MGLLLFTASACAAASEAVDSGEANLDEGDAGAADAGALAPLRYDGQVSAAKLKFRLGAAEIVEAKGAPFLKITGSTVTAAGVTGRAVQLQALSKVGAAASLPALVVQLGAEQWSARTIACDDDPALTFVVVQPGNVRLESVSQPVAGGQASKRACTVTVEQATGWEDWKRSQGPAAMGTMGNVNPRFGTTRTVVRAHFEADVGPRTSTEVTLHVSGAFDLWDDRTAQP